MERETRSRCVARHPRSNCNIYNTGNILNSIIPVLYQCIVTCMHEINYAIVLRIILHPRYQQSHGRGVNGFLGVAMRGDVVQKTVGSREVVLGGVGLVGGKLADSGEDREI